MNTQNDKPLGEQLGWHLLGSRFLYESSWYKLRQDTLNREGHGETTYTYVEHPGSVYVVPVTADQQILLIRSYRFPLDAWAWEVPAGSMWDTNNAEPETVALQELREEAGARCHHLERLGGFFLGTGFAHHFAQFFLAHGTEQTVSLETEAFEQIEQVAAFSFSEIRTMIREGTITDGDSVLALLLAFHSLSGTQEVIGEGNSDEVKHNG